MVLVISGTVSTSEKINGKNKKTKLALTQSYSKYIEHNEAVHTLGL